MFCFSRRAALARAVTVLLVFACAAVASGHAQTTRYTNLVNNKFATISSGPQSSVVVDAPKGADDAAMRKLVQKSVRSEWAARGKALNAQIAQLKRSGLIRGRAVLPISTLITVRQNGKLILPKRSVTRSVGPGTLTFRYTGFADSDKAFLQQFAALAYPRIVALYGDPAQTAEIEVVNTGPLDTSTISEVQRLAFGGYDVSNNRILLPIYESVDSFAHAFLLNMIHAFHGPAVFQYDAWEQGFARAAASVIARDPVFNFDDASANNLYSLLKFYDLLNQPTLGNSTFFPPSQANIPIDGQFTIGKMLYPRLGMSGAAWLKVYIENQNFFRQFNAAYYAQFDPATNPGLAGNVPALRALAAPFLPSGVEGQSWDAWFSQQYILDTSVSVGAKLYAFVIPSENDATNGQSASVTLVYFRTKTSGDEDLLSGTAYSTYFDASNARVNLGIAAERTGITGGEGFVTTLAFPTQGFDAGRITADFHVGNAAARAYIPSGFSGDFQAVVLGTGSASSTASITQTSLPPIQTRSKTTNVENRAFGAGLGGNANDLSTTVVQVSDGATTKNYRFNTGDGQYYAVIRDGLSGGGVVTLSKTFVSGTVPQLVSFPLRPLSTNIEQALGLPGSDFLLSYWDATRPAYETLTAGQPSVSPIQPGRGYWLKVSPVSAAPEVGVSITGIAPASDTDFTIGCSFGWNIIGSPFSQPFDVSKILVQYLQNDSISWDDAVASNLVAAQPFEWNPTTGYGQTNTLSGGDWKGYWVRVLVPSGVTLILPGPDSPTSRAASLTRSVVTRAQKAAPPDWKIRLTARQSGQSGLPFIETASATLGVARDVKTRGFDSRYNLEMPPAIVPGVAVHFPHTDWGRAAGGRYVADFRSGIGTKTWDVLVDTPASGQATLTWDGLGSATRSARMTLVDVATGTRVPMRSRSVYQWSGEAGKSRAFQIVAQPGLSRPLAITNMTTVRTRAAAGAGLTISYNVTEDAEITVDLNALGGRLIRRLGSGRAQSAGLQNVHWDGRAQDGSSLPAGPYTLTITARSEDGSLVRQTRPVLLIP